MQIYTVGGYVRDMLLRQAGHDVPAGGDRDWVVVGSTPEEMLEKGFTPSARTSLYFFTRRRMRNMRSPVLSEKPPAATMGLYFTQIPA